MAASRTRRRPTVILALLAALIGGATMAAPSAEATNGVASQLARMPYLTDLSPDTVTVNWATDRSGSTGSVTWGRVDSGSCTTRTTAATRLSISVDKQSRYQWQATLRGLEPDTEYCYRVHLGSTDLLAAAASPRFLSAVGTDRSSFSFAVLGDWGVVDAEGRNPYQAAILRSLAESDARFVVNTGDTPNGSGSQTDYGDLSYPRSSVFAPDFWAVPGPSLPFYPPLGNHGMRREFLDNWPQTELTRRSAGRYEMRTYCCEHGTRSDSRPSGWYAFDAGNARFYILQSAWPNSNVGTSDIYGVDHAYHWTPQSEQYRWLEADLAKHSETPLKFAFFHFPLYSDNRTETSNLQSRIDGPNGWDSLEGLLSRHGVDMVFNGHAHIYQRNEPRYGMIAYTTGGGGARLAPIGMCSATTAYAIGWSNSNGTGSSCRAPRPSRIEQVYHYLHVRIDGTRVIVTPIDATGTAFDAQTYDLAPRPPDTSPPSVPTGLSVTAASEGMVARWEPSVDDVGVAGYRVHIEGQQVQETTETTATLTGLACGTTYELEVEAFDGAGNVSLRAGVVAATEACTFLHSVFEEGFESGDLRDGGWTSSGLVVQQDVVPPDGGTWAARASGAGTVASAWASLPRSSRDVVHDLRFQVVDRGANSVNLMRAQRSNGGSIAGLSVSPSGRLTLRNDVAGVTTVSAVTVSTGRWHLVRLRLRIDGTASVTEVWLDGEPVPDLLTTATLGTTGAARVQLGETTSGRTYDVVLDDLLVAHASVDPPDESPPTAPEALSLTAASEGLLARWGPSSDDVGVAGYRVYVDGELILQTEDTTAGITGLICGTTYVVGVEAFDAVGNLSPRTEAAGATESCPSAFEVVYVEDFESGSLSAGGWTSSGLVTQQEVVAPDGGEWAARARGVGTVASAWASLPGSYREVVQELRFQVISKGPNSVGLFRVQRSNGGSIAGLSVSPTGRLSLRNDVAGVTTTSAATVSDGRWYHVRLRLRIDGAASMTEVWLDGQPVPDLLTTATLGTTAAARVQLGETTTGRTFDLALDDLIVGVPRA